MLARLEATSAVRREGDQFVLLPGFDVSIKLLDLDLPVDSLVEADAAITRHMDALADELTEILRTRVLAPYRKREPPSRTKGAVRADRWPGCASSRWRRSSPASSGPPTR